ncbi:hypothetical protein JEQ12_020014 [Ovis aries]|uniref:SUZ-C domain-containing protein n=1 Tax=Ovis aries TaxID=9940 RepID=A0A835ZR20_SHEEP|nr:hypothetical protein JEQ12_020014 [Ovis aries]
MDLKEAEDIKKRWQEYTKELKLYRRLKKDLRKGDRAQMVGKSKSSSRVPIVIQDDSLPRSPLYRLASSRGPTGVISSPNSTSRPALEPIRISQPKDSRYLSNVIRQRLGPDGSQSFKQHR